MKKSKGISNQMDMLNGSIFDKILLFALPLAISSILQQLFNSVDVAVVGRFASSEALAAVGSNSSVISLLINLFVGISVGANVVIANYIGQGKTEKIQDAVHTVMIISLISGVFLLVLGLAYFTSAVVVFFRDLTQIVNIVLQIGMWMTPIMWNISDILVNHPTLAKVFKLNPMYYIVDGFRNALLDHIWFWEKPLWTLAFWIITLLFFVIGVNVFNRLKVHFADVL